MKVDDAEPKLFCERKTCAIDKRIPPLHRFHHRHIRWSFHLKTDKTLCDFSSSASFSSSFSSLLLRSIVSSSAKVCLSLSKEFRRRARLRCRPCPTLRQDRPREPRRCPRRYLPEKDENRRRRLRPRLRPSRRLRLLFSSFPLSTPGQSLPPSLRWSWRIVFCRFEIPTSHFRLLPTSSRFSSSTEIAASSSVFSSARSRMKKRTRKRRMRKSCWIWPFAPTRNRIIRID